VSLFGSGGYFIPTARETLISALSAATSNEHAGAIVEALDGYLAEDPTDRGSAPVLRRPDLRAEVQTLRQELDKAVARAEKAERALAELKKQKTRSAKKGSK
jgi:hypothetical protein